MIRSAVVLSIAILALAGPVLAAFEFGMSDLQCVDEVKAEVKAGIPANEIAWDARQAELGIECVFNGLNDALVSRPDIVAVLLDAGWLVDEVRAAALAKGWPESTVDNLIAEATQPVNPILNPDLGVATGGGQDAGEPPSVSPN